MNRDKLLSYLVLVIIILGVLFLYTKRVEAGPLDRNMTLTWAVDLRCGTVAYPDSARSPEIAEWGLDGTTTVLGTQAAATKADRTMTITSPLMEYGKRYWAQMYVNLAPGTCAGGDKSPPSAKVYKTMPLNTAPPNPPAVTIASTAFEQQPLSPGFRLTQVGTVSLGTACGSTWNQDPRFARVTYLDVTFKRPFLGGILYGVCG